MHAVCEAFWMSWLSLYYWVIWIAKSLETAAGAPALHSTAPSQCTVIWFDKNCPKNQVYIKRPIHTSAQTKTMMASQLAWTESVKS